MCAPLPTAANTLNHLPVEDMVAGKSAKSIPSFTDWPAGADRFSMIRTEPFGFGRVIMPLTFTSGGVSSAVNGPIANPAATHDATASVTSLAHSNALGALPLLDGRLNSPLHPMSAPCTRSLHTRSNLSGSEVPTAMAMLRKPVAEIMDFPLAKFLGNFAPKLGGGTTA